MAVLSSSDFYNSSVMELDYFVTKNIHEVWFNKTFVIGKM